MITPVLTLDESRISSYDPQDPAHLALLWSGKDNVPGIEHISVHPLTRPLAAFSKTSHVVDQGERLRNLSWRLWNRERLCCLRNQRPIQRSAPTPQNTPASSVHSSIPQLSTSVESSSSTESEEDTAATSALSASGSIAIRKDQRQPQERHITPLDLRNMVHSIKQPHEFHRQARTMPPSRATEASRPAPTGSNLAAAPSPRHVVTESSTSTVATAATDSFTSAGGKSDTTASSNTSSQHSIVRGFTPGPSGVTSYTSKIQMAPQPQPQPILKKPSVSLPGLSQKKSNGMFMLGCSSGSGGSGEEEESLRDSVISRSLRSSGGSSKLNPAPKKQTSFKDEVAVMKPNAHEDAAVFDESDDEDGSDSEVSESAIEEEDDDAWEDEGSDTQPSEPQKKDEMKFYRVDSAAHLPSRKSALTLTLEGQRNNTLYATPTYKRSRTSTPNGPSMPGSPEADSQLEMRAHQMGASKPIIHTTTNTQALPPLTSPRTTRRNMMNGELSESLRKHMLSERQQRNPLQIDPTQMRRAHTAYDVPRMGKLPEHGEAPKAAGNGDLKNKSAQWDHYFEQRSSDYHEAGW
ncbi:MAG: hypothetical protein Q9162_007963 [Coniocarpon cinnabarinum]